MYGNDDLAAGGGAAGDVPGEGFDIGDDDGRVPRPGRPADALPVRDMHAGDGALEGAENQFLPRHAVESGPPETELGVQDGGDVRHLGDGVRLPLEQGGQLALQQAVFFSLFHYNKKVKWQNHNVLPLILQ